MADEDHAPTDQTPTDEGQAPDEQAPDEQAPDEQAAKETTTARSPEVSRLRRESGRLRERAISAEQNSDDLARELWVARVAATGLLADPGDLQYDADKLADPDAIRTAAENLVAEKPHLRSRAVSGSIGQGEGGDNSGHVDLAAMLRRRA